MGYIYIYKALYPFRIILSVLVETCFPSTVFLIRYTREIGRDHENGRLCDVKTDRTNSGAHPTAANRIKPKRRFSLKLTNSIEESNDELTRASQVFQSNN